MMLLHEDMHQVAGMSALNLKGIWYIFRKKLQNELFSTKGLLCGVDQKLKCVWFVRSM